MVFGERFERVGGADACVVHVALVGHEAGDGLEDVGAHGGQNAGDLFQGPLVVLLAGAVELVGASLESLLVSAGRAGTAFIVRAVPTILALVLLDAAIDWSGAKGAAFAVLGSSSLAVVGFYVAILNLQEIRITVSSGGEAGDRPALPPGS